LPLVLRNSRQLGKWRKQDVVAKVTRIGIRRRHCGRKCITIDANGRSHSNVSTARGGSWLWRMQVVALLSFFEMSFEKGPDKRPRVDMTVASNLFAVLHKWKG
jgi:hypothetical protein